LGKGFCKREEHGKRLYGGKWPKPNLEEEVVWVTRAEGQGMGVLFGAGAGWLGKIARQVEAALYPSKCPLLALKLSWGSGRGGEEDGDRKRPAECR
jgi:hypothetical protein